MRMNEIRGYRGQQGLGASNAVADAAMVEAVCQGRGARRYPAQSFVRPERHIELTLRPGHGMEASSSILALHCG
jgi:hypothetical protein